MQTVEVGVSDPEMAVLRAAVWDRRPGGEPQFLCYVTMPACALRTGYRNVPMRDKHGCKIAFCKMLWHVRTSHTHMPVGVKQANDHNKPSATPAERLYTGRSGTEEEMTATQMHYEA